MNDLKKISEELSEITNCLNENKFEIDYGDGYIRIVTPFLYENNDHVVIYIVKDDKGIYLSDDGENVETIIDYDEEIFEMLVEKYMLNYNKKSMFIYKKIKMKGFDVNSLMRKIIDFANDLQRISSIYSFLMDKKMAYKLVEKLI